MLVPCQADQGLNPEKLLRKKEWETFMNLVGKVVENQ